MKRERDRDRRRGDKELGRWETGDVDWGGGGGGRKRRSKSEIISQRLERQIKQVKGQKELNMLVRAELKWLHKQGRNRNGVRRE